MALARREDLPGVADFAKVYDMADPRTYYASVGQLNYQAPAHGVPIFRRLSEALRATGKSPTLLDLCCSYGVNAALLNHDLTFEGLHDHYLSTQRKDLGWSEALGADQRFFAARCRPDALNVIGLDIARHAVDYAVGAGLLDDGVVADLEIADPPTAVTSRLAHVDLVIVTGGTSYVKERTFEAIMAAASGDLPWVAALTLRWIGFEAIADTLGKYGLVTERLDGYVARQRRFSDDEERDHVFALLAERALRPTPLEENGWHCAELFVARPRHAVRDLPLRDVLGAVAHVCDDTFAMPWSATRTGS